MVSLARILWRPIRGTWAIEDGGALITQAIHQTELLLCLAGRIRHVYGEWQVGAVHKIESEDVITAIVRYASGATGVIQASTAFKPGYPERIEIHGTAIITGDQLTTWDVAADSGEEPAPLQRTCLRRIGPHGDRACAFRASVSGFR